MKTVRQLHLEAIVSHLSNHDWRFGPAVVYPGKVHLYPEDLKTSGGDIQPGVVLFARRETADRAAYNEVKYVLAIEIAVVTLLTQADNPLWKTEEIRGEVISVFNEIDIDDTALYYMSGDVRYPRSDEQSLVVVLNFNFEFYTGASDPYPEPVEKSIPMAMVDVDLLL